MAFASSELCGCDFSPRFAGAFTLRQRMLNFVQNIQYYMMFEVMEPTWHILEKNLKLVSEVGMEGLTNVRPNFSSCSCLLILLEALGAAVPATLQSAAVLHHLSA